MNNCILVICYFMFNLVNYNVLENVFFDLSEISDFEGNEYKNQIIIYNSLGYFNLYLIICV